MRRAVRLQVTVAGLSVLLAGCVAASGRTRGPELGMPRVERRPLIIAHRGATGYRPEHTLEAYGLAIDMGADYIEPDVVMTRDRVLVARHENEIGGTTDVAQRFPERRRTQVIDGDTVTGWFTEDFTLAELRSLRARERLAQRSHAYDGRFGIPTLDEVLALVRQRERASGRTIGVYPETKHPSHFRRIGLPVEDSLLAVLARHGYRGRGDAVFIQSFEVGNLRALRARTTIRLVQLVAGGGVPPDVAAAGGTMRYVDLITPAGLRGVAEYADAVGAHKWLVLPREAAGDTARATALVREAHAAGLQVHVWTMRSDTPDLPAGFAGDAIAEWRAFAAVGVDGIFGDFPDVGVRALRPSPAARDTTASLRLGGFVDGYYAWDFNRPRGLDRAYTTQPARHNEFNVNLAYVDAVLSGARVRGRLALQYGTSVQVNYAGEPRRGAWSGSELTRHLQEAVAGVRLAPSLWVDGGIFLSHIGSESWISRDNLTYTRSLIADFSPYYQAGVKLTWNARPALAAQLHLLNGWQVVSESNGGKAMGARIDWTATSAVTLSTYNFLGDEGADSTPRGLRYFQGISARVAPHDRLVVSATLDAGREGAAATEGEAGEAAQWYGASAILRVQATPAVAFVGRVERYADESQVIVRTATGAPFRVSGGSIGLDVAQASRALWRTEFRMLHGGDAVFPARGAPRRGNALLVSSLAMTF